MAVDILIHKAHKVPVGKDQEQHLEMTRQFGNRFNRLYNVDYFPEPIAFTFSDKLVKVPGLTGKGKMSKSGGEGDAIFLADESAVTTKKIMRAVTDEGPKVPNQTKPEVVQNLFDLMALVSQPDVIEHFDTAYNNCSIRYGDLKKQLAADMDVFLTPIREHIKESLSNEAVLGKAAKIGAEKARESASKTLKEVREIIRFRKFY
jgi:tryptophanyl-tRNA synthetase